MKSNLSSDRVNGFLHAKGRTIVNGAEEEIVLSGWGLGNWLLCEGYMWKSYGSRRFDRPNRIEAVIRELTGSNYADHFWKQFRENYITKEDIRRMAELGYNSVRIPFNWRIFMETEPGLIWKEEGFELLDRCLDWCEEYKLYAFLDLHGAPGGQTGANIDDCIDDVPRLFLDQDSWDKGIALWSRLAERYCNRWIVGGYDLLNEPIAPGTAEGKNYDYLLPKLVEFYEKAIAAIRKTDDKHMISIEGHHWATNTQVFTKKYDDNMVIHFHRYACLPDVTAYQEFIDLSEKLDAPLWMGETGENIPEWFTAMYPLSAELGIGYNLWPWKKMSCTNSPYSVKEPEGWNKIIGYTKGEPHPGYPEAQRILDHYLENMKLEQCDYNPVVTQAVFRIPGCTVRATDFDEFPGKGISYSGIRTQDRMDHQAGSYRNNTGMAIVEKAEPGTRRFAFDCQWDRFALELGTDEFATYTIHDVMEGNAVQFKYFCENETIIHILQDGQELTVINLLPGEEVQLSEKIKLYAANESKITLMVMSGMVKLDSILYL